MPVVTYIGDWAEWPKILPTVKLIRVNSSWGAPNAFYGTAWAQVTNVEGVKPQDWPVKNANLSIGLDICFMKFIVKYFRFRV